MYLRLLNFEVIWPSNTRAAWSSLTQVCLPCPQPPVGGPPLSVSSNILLHHGCSWVVHPQSADFLFLFYFLSCHDAMPLLLLLLCTYGMVILLHSANILLIIHVRLCEPQRYFHSEILLHVLNHWDLFFRLPQVFHVSFFIYLFLFLILIMRSMLFERGSFKGISNSIDCTIIMWQSMNILMILNLYDCTQ